MCKICDFLILHKLYATAGILFYNILHNKICKIGYNKPLKEPDYEFEIFPSLWED